MKGPDIKYSGQPVAYVVAENAAAARRGAALVDVTYEEGESIIEMDPAQSFPIEPLIATKGDVSAGMAEAAQTIDAEYTSPFQHHNPMEMFAATAEWSGDQLTLWMPSQSVRTVRMGGEVKVPPTALALTETEALARLRY